MMKFLAVLSLLFSLALSIPVDNGVEGDPEIECGPNAVTINFNTQNSFEGHVFVKGLYNQEGCRIFKNSYHCVRKLFRSDEGGNRVAGITLPFDTCSVRRTRSLNPRGMFVGTTVVITFHPQFITKVDRAYKVECFYMEADKTVSSDIEVSMLTTGFQTQLVPMPLCRYEILEGGPNGQIIRFALVGQPVYHKWTCDTETVDTFCMRIHSCFVDDGAGDKVDLLDSDGCAQDRYLLRNLEYLTDLMAGQETHVFKYADRAQLFFQCQITMTIKEPNQQCPRPACAEPARGRRSALQDQSVTGSPILGTMDVFTQFDTFELDDSLPASSSSKARIPEGPSSKRISNNDDSFCLSIVAFILILTVTAVLFLASLSAVVCLCVRRR